MDNSPIPGFITRIQAAERYKPAERTLQRYWSKAVTHGDCEVLQHLKLRTEDGKITAGQDVTRKLIEQYKHEGRLPKWYVHAGWAEKTYGASSDRANDDQSHQDEAAPLQSTGRSPSSVVEILQDRIHDKEKQLDDKDQEIAYLRGLVKDKGDLEKERNQLEAERNQREKDTNELMRQLGVTLGTLKGQRLLGSESSGDSDHSASRAREKRQDEKNDDLSVRDVQVATPAKPCKRQKKKAGTKGKGEPVSSDNRLKTKSIRKASKSTTTRTARWYETPTITRILSRRR